MYIFGEWIQSALLLLQIFEIKLIVTVSTSTVGSQINKYILYIQEFAVWMNTVPFLYTFYHILKPEHSFDFCFN